MGFSAESNEFNITIRLIIPNTRLIEGTVRIFVKTGRKIGDTLSEEHHKIVVDVAVNSAYYGYYIYDRK